MIADPVGRTLSQREGRPDVSIIIVTFDSRDDVLACLASVELHAEPLTTELILVDNGSTDGTVEAVAERHPDVIRVRRERNEGVRARNYGLRIASGRFRMFLDSDARLTPGALPQLVAFMDQHPDVGLVGPTLTYPDGTVQPSARRFPPLLLPFLRRPPLGRFLGDSATVRRHLMVDEPRDRTRSVPYVLGACQLFSEGAQRAAGEIEPWISFGPDDIDWCMRIRAVGLKVAHHPASTVIHKYRRGTATRPVSRRAVRHLTSYYRFQWKWRWTHRRLFKELQAGAGERDLGEIRKGDLHTHRGIR